MRGEYSLADIKAVTDGNNGGYGNGMFGGDWAWIIVLFLIFGWGRNGFGNGFGGNGGGAVDGYVLATDFATIERKLDAVNNGICDATFALNNTINTGFFGVQNSLTQGFSGLNTALLQGNCALSRQLADCCCTIERGIDGINYNNAINTNALSRQISDCCCDLEKMNMQNRFDAQTYNCNTLQAIDKLGDRIINQLTQDKIDTLTAENQSLRLKASQEAQNNYLVSTLRPCPQPAYLTCNPFTGQVYGSYGNCGCNNY